MADPAEQIPQAQSPSAWEQQYNNLANGVSRAMAQMQEQTQAQISQLAERLERGQNPAPQMPANMDEQLTRALLTTPTRTFADYTQLLRNETRKEMREEIERYRQQEVANQTWNQFWGEFYQFNGDLAPYRDMVDGLFNRAFAQSNGNPSEAANQVAAHIRGVLAQERASAVESERRSRNGARATSSGGSQMTSAVQQMMSVFNPSAAAGEGFADPREDLHDYVKMREIERGKRMRPTKPA